MGVTTPIKTKVWTPEHIKALRLRHGLTQQQIAEVIGING
jgi:DNA-binding XRE family transcriptional regulator